MRLRPLEDHPPTTGAAPPRPRTSRTPTDLQATPSASLPRLKFTQVAFAGHNRPEDLGDPAHISTGLETAFAMLAQAGVDEARLITGLAPGADLLAAEAWTASGLGPGHGVFPFLDDTVAGPTAALMEAGPWLDGRATESLGRHAYLAQTRWACGAAARLAARWTAEQT